MSTIRKQLTYFSTLLVYFLLKRPYYFIIIAENSWRSMDNKDSRFQYMYNETTIRWTIHQLMESLDRAGIMRIFLLSGEWTAPRQKKDQHSSAENGWMSHNLEIWAAHPHEKHFNIQGKIRESTKTLSGTFEDIHNWIQKLMLNDECTRLTATPPVDDVEWWMYSFNGHATSWWRTKWNRNFKLLLTKSQQS